MDTIQSMNGSVTLAQLDAFVAVASEQHVTRAARRLGLSQPAVSHQLKRLEQSLRLPLFERAGRGVRLTDAGRSLLPLAAAALSAARAVEEGAAAHRGLVAGQLFVAASNTIGIYRLPAWLAGFVEAYPGVAVRVRLVNTAEAIMALEAGEVDCALVEGPEQAEDAESLVVEADELVVVTASHHPLAACAKQRPGEVAAALRSFRYLSREPGSGTEALAETLLGPAYRSGPVLELGQVDAVRSAALAGLGYAVLPLAAIGADLEAGRLVRLPVGRGGLRREFRALRRRARPGPALEAFFAHLAGIAAAASRGPQATSRRSASGVAGPS
jgi:DNA-binding transcriptional LysR family regulator